MRIMFVADARSPIALNWIRYFVKNGDEVYLVSTYPAAPLAGLAEFSVIPVAFSSAATHPGKGSGRIIRKISTTRVRTFIRQWLGTLTLNRASKSLAHNIETVRPDLIHAMRIPYEGMLGARAKERLNSMAMRSAPLLVSIWGNDFTLHAQSNSHMARHTRHTLAITNAIHADCNRDIRLAHEWGFPENRPHIVLPGGGGIQPDIFFPDLSIRSDQKITIIQPRGMRPYVQNEAFFEAIPLVLKKYPEARFVCPGMAGENQVENLISRLDISHAVTLLPKLSRAELADWFRKSAIMVSPTTHDGTPNTLLEALASGCFPIAGDIESIREWIKHGENGLMVDAESPDSIASGIQQAIENAALRAAAQPFNLDLIKNRANYGPVMKAAEKFYRAIIA